MRNKDHYRETLIRSGVNSLGTFGYPDVRPENLLTDPIYSAFFKSMLEGELGEVQRANPAVANVMRDLISECAGLDALTPTT